MRDDSAAAAPAWTSTTLVDPRVLTTTKITCSRLPDAILVRVEQATRPFDESVDSGHHGHRCPRVDAGQEAGLGLVQVSYPRQVALVEERLADRSFPSAGQPPHRLVKVPVGSEQIWTEMAYHRLFSRSAQHLHETQPEANTHPVGRCQDQAYLETGTAPPAAHAVKVPRAVHLEVRVHRQARLRPEQQVLAPGHHFADSAAGQIHV